MWSLLALLALSTPAAAPSPLVSTKPWNVEAQEDMCLLSREFGTGKDSVLLGFQPIFDSEQMDVLVVSHHKTGESATGEALVERMPDGTKFKSSYLMFGIAKSDKSLARISVPRAVFDQLGTTDTLRIKAGSLKILVKITGFAKAKPVFEQCETDLLKSWDVDPASLTEGRAARPIGDLQRIFDRKGYPPDAFAQGYIGRVTAVLNIDAAGKVTKCRVVIGGGKVLSDATCARAMALRFALGTDLHGASAASIFVLRVKWQIGSMGF